MTAATGRAMLGAGLLYLLALLVIGAFSARVTRDERDFYAAGRRLGLVVAALATMASSFSGFLFIGGPGLVYATGTGALFLCLPVGFTSGLLLWTVARPLRRLAREAGAMTIPDALRARYRSAPCAALGSIALFLGVIFYLAAQLLALSLVLERLGGLRAADGAGLPLALIAGTAVLALYCVAGGMVAGIYTDVLQGLLMIAASVGAFALALRSAGGPQALLAAIAADPRFGPEFAGPFGAAGPMTAFAFFFLFGVGTLGQPHLLHKFYMIGDAVRLRWFPLVTGTAQSLCLLVMVGIGLGVPALVARGRLPPLDRPDDAAAAFLTSVAPAPLAGLLFAGVLAAVMSTADAFANIAAAAMTRDLPRALGLRPLTRLAAGRAATVAVLLAAASAAWLRADLVALLGTLAFGIFAASLAPALAVGLNWDGVTARAASVSVAAGLLLPIALDLAARQPLAPQLARSVPRGALAGAFSLALSLLLLLAVSAADRRRAR